MSTAWFRQLLGSMLTTKPLERGIHAGRSMRVGPGASLSAASAAGAVSLSTPTVYVERCRRIERVGRRRHGERRWAYASRLARFVP